MKNIVLVSLPKVETTFPPGSLAILSSVANDNGFDVSIFDYNVDLYFSLEESEWDALESWCSFVIEELPSDLEQKLKKIFIENLKAKINQQTEFVCFSVFSYFSNKITVKVLEWYRSEFDIKTVIGGTGVSTDTSSSNKEIFGEFIIKNKLADFVVFGEGELTFDSILKQQFDRPGINKNNPVQIEDLTHLPTPTYEYFDMSRYQNKKILITGSRGCVRKCTFCDIELTWPKFRYRDASNIIEEIKQNFYEYGITKFEFTDSLINGSISNFNKFNEMLYEEKQRHPDLEPIRYQGQFICRPASQQKELTYELMHLAGCEMLITGIESFSESVRNHMKKRFSNQDIDYHLEQCARWGIPNILLMIVGYPTETLADHEKNLETLVRYKKYVDMNTIFMIRWGYTMHLYEHTPIMSMLEELDINLENNVKFDSLYGWVSNLNPGNTLQERIRRRLEIHELCVELGYPMPRVREELLGIKNLAVQYENFKQQPQKIFEIKQV
jgi:radical SAM superfamily enzyme YgiQ (UPF0313 family)